MPQKKRGRPTENLKAKKISVRLDDEMLKVLDSYCEKNNVSRTEGVRRGISMLK